MDKHTRFHIDLTPEHGKLLTKLAAHLTMKLGVTVSRPVAVRMAIEVLAKKEKVGQ